MKQSRNYQEAAIKAVSDRWAHGSKSVCLVGPTGCGKTYMMSRLVGESKAVWVAPRRELVEQAAKELRGMYGRENVGLIMPGRQPNPSARIQVGTIGTLLRRGAPTADLFVLDEAHHYVANQWRQIVDRNPSARFLGGTAVPERADGTGLSDIFDREPVHVASYSQMVKDGVLVPWKIWRPTSELGHDLAMDAIDAWELYSEGGKTFAFFIRKLYAYDHAARWAHRGVRARCVESGTGSTLRGTHMDGFRGESLDVLTNVFCLTEGVDVPHASVVLLARPFHHRSSFVNACGRAGRSADGKTHAVLIDLCGSSINHGSPVDDWKPTLDGRAKGTPRDDVEPPERHWSAPINKDVGLVLADGPTAAPPSAIFRPKPRADRVEKILDKVARRSGAAVAEKMRAAYGGFAE